MEAYDVVVVGGGPAGATAALRLAQRGARVALIEKDRLPRYKPCGGGLTPETVKMLAGVDLSSVIEDQILRADFLIHYRRVYSWSDPSGSAAAVTMVMRDRFDQLLVELAARHGAVVRDGLGVREIEREEGHYVVRAGRETFYARALVGADGAKGPTARALGLRTQRRPGVALEAEVVPARAEDFDTYRHRVDMDFMVVPNGYGWVFPKAEHLSIGLGSFQPRAGDLRRLLDAYLPRKLSGEWRTLRLQGHPLPINTGSERLHDGAACLVGDAAGLVEPLWGEGIQGAIASAQIAAEEIMRYLAEEVPDLASYTQAISERVLGRYGRGRVSARVMYGTLRALETIVRPRRGLDAPRMSRG